MESHEHESIQFDLSKQLKDNIRSIFYDKDAAALNVYLRGEQSDPIVSKVDTSSMLATLEQFDKNVDGTLNPKVKSLCVYSIKYHLRKHVQFDDDEQEWYSENYPNDPGLVNKEEEEEKDRRTNSEIVLEAATTNIQKLFVDEYQEPHAAISVNGHIETIPVKSRRFRNYLANLVYNECAKIVNSETVKEVVNILSAKAEFDESSEIIKLNLRVGADGNGNGKGREKMLYYDLTNKQWQFIEITNQGWRVITAEESPVLFNRYGQIPQVMPERQYSPDILDKFIALANINNDNDKLLAKVYLIVAFIPEIAHPIYSPFGGPGAAKSMWQIMIKRTVDPASFDLLTIPTDKNEFIQQLGHNYMTIYDNLKQKRVPSWFAQDICSAVTGAGNIKRVLFTDDEDFARKYKRCLGFNGINVALTESDVASRSITVKMETIPKEKNRTESDVYAEYDNLKPGLLGFIFDTISKVLAKIDSVELKDLPRLGDFAIWGEAVARVLGYQDREFLEAYYDNIGKQNAESVESDNVGETVVKLCDALVDQKRTIWIGPVRELLNDLKMIAETINIDTNSKDWPKLSNGLSRRLNEIRTSLLSGFGIQVTIEKLKSDREIEDEIEKTVVGTPFIHKYKRDTTLVTIMRLERGVKEES